MEGKASETGGREEEGKGHVSSIFSGPKEPSWPLGPVVLMSMNTWCLTE